MRISRRTSGGRGEYEFSGITSTGDGVASVLDKLLTLEFPEDILVHSRIVGRKQGGKPRLRREGAEIQIQKQLAATFLMPDPVRDDAALGAGEPVMQRGAYAIEHIEIDSLIHVSSEVLDLRISNIIVLNHSNHGEEIDLRERARMLVEVWNRREEFPQEIASVLERHYNLVAGGFVGREVEQIVEEIQRAVSERSADLGLVYSELGDVLPKLADALHYQVPQPLIDVERVDPENIPLKRRAVKEWKYWANARGPASAKFRQQVRNAYNSTCAVCGAHYPKTPFNANPGVDAAHILPWNRYDLDEVFNGLCLCKIHHWAFDEGILSISYDGKQYVSEVTRDAEEAIVYSAPFFSVDKLRSGTGIIPIQRLPADSALWPHPELLAMLAESY